jgi:hypothetical protein
MQVGSVSSKFAQLNRTVANVSTLDAGNVGIGALADDFTVTPFKGIAMGIPIKEGPEPKQRRHGGFPWSRRGG